MATSNKKQVIFSDENEKILFFSFFTQVLGKTPAKIFEQLLFWVTRPSTKINDDGSFHVPQKTMYEYLEISKRQFAYGIKKLTDSGIITIKHGHGKICNYSINLQHFIALLKNYVNENIPEFEGFTEKNCTSKSKIALLKFKNCTSKIGKFVETLVQEALKYIKCIKYLYKYKYLPLIIYLKTNASSPVGEYAIVEKHHILDNEMNPNNTPDNTPKTDQLIPNGSFTPRGRRTTVPGQLPKKLKYTKQEEQFAQKVYENISARFPKHMKKYPWPKVRQEWCIGLHRACNANGGFEFVSEAIWWAIQYDTFIQKNMRSLARINKMWKNGSTCIESIISSYASHVLYETSNKRATPKFIWKTVYYTLIERGVAIEQAQIWADEMTEAMEALQQIIEGSYRERNVKLNYYWFLEKDFLKIVKQNTIDFDVHNLWNNLPDIIKNFGNGLYDQIQAGNVTWLDRSIFSLKNTIDEFCNG